MKGCTLVPITSRRLASRSAMKRLVNLSEAARGAPGPTSDAAVDRRRKRLGADLAAVARTGAPYGAVGIEIRIGDIAVPIINPFALLWLLCTLCVCFAALRGGWPCARGLVR